MSEPTKAMTLRLPKSLADKLAIVAQIDELDVVEIVRQALRAHIEQRVADPQFRADVRNHITDIGTLIGEPDA